MDKFNKIKIYNDKDSKVAKDSKAKVAKYEDLSYFEKVKLELHYTFLINPNISYKRLLNDRFKNRLFKRLKEMLTEMEFELDKEQYHKPYKTKEGKLVNYNPKVIDYNWYPEIGSKAHFLHIHGNVSFTRQMDLNYHDINTWIKHQLRDFTLQPFISWKIYKDPAKIIRSYNQKDQ